MGILERLMHFSTGYSTINYVQSLLLRSRPLISSRSLLSLSFTLSPFSFRKRELPPKTRGSSIVESFLL